MHLHVIDLKEFYFKLAHRLSTIINNALVNFNGVIYGNICMQVL